MKRFALTLLPCFFLLIAQVFGQTAKNEFPFAVDKIQCSVKAYQPKTPIVFTPIVDKNSLPKSQIIVGMMLTKSDISSYMTDEEIMAFMGPNLAKELIQEFRTSTKERLEITKPTAEDNPWKGMKYVVDRVFVIESEKGKFLVYQLSTQGGKDLSGKLFGILNHRDGKWSAAGDKTQAGQDFRLALQQRVPSEFDKLHTASPIECMPLEDLLN